MSILDGLKEADRERMVMKTLSAPDKFTHLAKSVQAWMDSWPAQGTDTDVLRASHAYNVCPREFVLNYWRPVPNRSFDWVAQMRMSTGTHLHHYLQNNILGPMGVLYGNWGLKESIAHETELVHKRGFYPDPEEAAWATAHSKPLKWVYLEDEVWDEHWRIRGHIDGYVDVGRIAWLYDNAKLFKSDPVEACKRLHSLPESVLFHFEIKTTSKYGFESLHAPRNLPDYYKMQSVIYQKLTGKSATLFWYIERDSMESKALVYPYEDGWWKDVTRKARIIWEAIRDETLPESGMACKMPTDKRAKACVHRESCWLTKFDFKKYVEKAKADASSTGRKFLDLSDWTADVPTVPATTG